MKKRSGFVSNSSSSSFILKNQNEIEIFRNTFGDVPIFNVGELRQHLKKILDDVEAIKKKFNDSFYFLEENLICDTFNSTEILQDLDGVSDDAYITDAVDRDEAYNRGYVGDTFRGDL